MEVLTDLAVEILRNMYVYQLVMLYTLNLHSVTSTCQGGGIILDDKQSSRVTTGMGCDNRAAALSADQDPCPMLSCPLSLLPLKMTAACALDPKLLL